MPKKAKSTTQKLVACKAAYKTLQETMEEQIRLRDEQIESLKRHPPVLPADRDERGNVMPEQAAEPEPVPASKPQTRRYRLPPGRAFRVVRAGEQVALTAKALGGGSATMLFTRQLARRVGMLLCKATRPEPQEATITEGESAEQPAAQE